MIVPNPDPVWIQNYQQRRIRIGKKTYRIHNTGEQCKILSWWYSTLCPTNWQYRTCHMDKVLGEKDESKPWVRRIFSPRLERAELSGTPYMAPQQNLYFRLPRTLQLCTYFARSAANPPPFYRILIPNHIWPGCGGGPSQQIYYLVKVVKKTELPYMYVKVWYKPPVKRGQGKYRGSKSMEHLFWVMSVMHEYLLTFPPRHTQILNELNKKCF
jgi:hypothetical protein